MVLDAADFLHHAAQVENDSVHVGVEAVFDFGNDQAIAFLGAEDKVVVQAGKGVGPGDVVRVSPLRGWG